jgi:hypothetical protein
VVTDSSLSRRFAWFVLAGVVFLIPRLATAESWSTGGSAAPFYMFPSQASTNVGIGSNAAPSFQFQLFSKAPSTEANAGIQGYGKRSALYFLRADILNSAPTTVGPSDTIGILESRGYSGTSGYMSMSAIDFKVDGSVTPGQRPPSMIEFSTNTANGNPTVNMLIKSDGKVVVGNATPNALFNVSTAVPFNTDASIARFGNKVSTGRTVDMSVDYRGSMGDGTLVLREDRAALDFMIVNMLAASNKIVFPNGNIGIGQTTPAAKLDVNGNLNVANRATITGNTSGQEALVVNQNQATGPIADFRQGNVSKVTFDNAGNVGIGTNAPSQKLDVSGNANVKGQVILEGDAMCFGSRYGNPYNDFWRIGMDHQTDDGGILHIRTGDNSNEAIYFEQSSDPGITNAANVRMAVAANGSIGIGTVNPTAYLHVSGAGVGAGMSGIDLTNTVSPGHTFKLSAGIKGISEGGFTIMDRTAGDVPRVAIDNNGNVGIGISNPGTKLDIQNGNTRVMMGQGGVGTGLGSGIIQIQNQSGRIFDLSSTFDGLAVEIGVNHARSDGNGRDEYALTGTKKSPYIRLNGEKGAIFLFGENGSGGDYRSPTNNLGVFVGSNGYVGIGDSFPDCKLSVADRAKITGRTDGQEALIVDQAQGTGSIADFRQGGASKFNIANNGDVTAVGAFAAASITTKVWSVAPDYVFEKDYKLASLEHVEKYVDENKHLPGIPSAGEIKNKGLDLAEMNMKLLRKVEELTLYSIKQEKRISELSARMEKVEKR